MNKKLWIVGKRNDLLNRWEFQGVFDEEFKAVNACKDDKYFVSPVNLNEEHAPDDTNWENAYIPLKKENTTK